MGLSFPVQSFCIVECLLHTQQCTICLLPVSQEPRSLVTTLFEVSYFFDSEMWGPAPSAQSVRVSFMLKQTHSTSRLGYKVVNWNRFLTPFLPQGWVPSTLTILISLSNPTSCSNPAQCPAYCDHIILLSHLPLDPPVYSFPDSVLFCYLLIVG